VVTSSSKSSAFGAVSALGSGLHRQILELAISTRDHPDPVALKSVKKLNQMVCANVLAPAIHPTSHK
jgi:hypothetical protein